MNTLLILISSRWRLHIPTKLGLDGIYCHKQAQDRHLYLTHDAICDDPIEKKVDEKKW